MERDFRNVMSIRSDEELIKIVTQDRNDYQPEAVLAAEQELNIRQISTEKINLVEQTFIKQSEDQKAIESSKVNSGVRLLNFIIDFLAIIIIYLIINLISKFIIKVTSIDIAYILAAIFFLVSFLGYYYFLEVKYQKTLAKFITDTKVTNLNGEKPDSSEIALRTFARLIPFDRVSFIFTRNGLHDLLSRTTVIKDSTKELLPPTRTV